MDSKAFFAEVKSGQWRPVYLLEGEEEYAKDRGVDALLAGVPEGLRDFNVDSLDDPDTETLRDLARTLPMMGDKRLILVKNSRLFGRSDAEGKAFVDFLPQIPDCSCMVFLLRGKADRRKSLYKAIAKLGGAVEFSPYGEGEAARWATAYAKRREVTLAPQEARLLVEMVGSHTGDIAGELDKLCDYADQGGTISEGMLRESVRPRLEYNVFSMLEDFLGKRYDKAFAQLGQSFREEGSGAGFQLTAFFASRLRAMLTARRLLDEGRREAEIVTAIGGNAYAAKRSLQSAKGFSANALENALLLLAEADFDAKTGQRPIDEALEVALTKIFVR